MGWNVFVSGGTGAVGEAIIRAFNSLGDNIEFSYHSSREQAESLCHELGLQAFPINLREEIILPASTPEIIINNAGINDSGHGVLETSIGEIFDSFRVNALAAVKYAQEYLPAMKKARYGRIVSVNSTHSVHVPANRLSYGISKSALRAFTQGVAREVASYGITINEVCPGPVDSAMLRRIAQRLTDRGDYETVAHYIEDLSAKIPRKRLIQPYEVASAVLYFASDAAGACTGQSLIIDGALT
jgi:2-hydroxycyclohexanecarboxyl-CoA dehydrogenase